MSSSTESIRQSLDRPATGWKPSPGDTVIGTVVEVDDYEGPYGAYPVVTIDTGDPELVAVHAFHAVLKNELARRKPVAGDQLGIKFLGKSNDKSYVSYRVKHERSGATPKAPDWERHARSADEELHFERVISEEAPPPEEPPPDLFDQPF